MRAKQLYQGFEEALDDIKRKPTTFYGRHANLLFNEEDLECILEVMKAGLEAMKEVKDAEYTCTLEVKPTNTYIENDIMIDGVKVGTVELEPKTKMITRLNIESAYQDKGYGTKVVNYLASQGYNNLWVNADNDRAIHVYEKCGFKLIKPTMFSMELSESKE